MIIPKIRQLPSGKFFCQLRIDGKSVSITESTEARCMARAMAIKTGLIEEKNAPASSLTLRKAIDKYIADKYNVLSPSTISGYRNIQRNRFKHIADTPIKNIKNWQSVVSIESKTCSPKTLKNAWGLVSSVLSYIDMKTPDVRLPQVVSDPRPFLRPPEVLEFVSAVKDKKYAIGALLALHSLRRSEILGLTWDNVDLNAKTIAVRGAVVSDEHGERVYKKENKNDKSRRLLPIMIPELYSLLEAVPNKSGRVVTISPNTLYRGINKTCKDLGFPEVGLHGLRHSFASTARHVGLDQKETMTIGGWANPQTMNKIYTHIAEQELAESENKLHEFFIKR